MIRFKKKDYKKVVAGVHSALRRSQARGSINYAVVGFGGPDGLAEPHTVTFGNKIYVEASGRLSNVRSCLLDKIISTLIKYYSCLPGGRKANLHCHESRCQVQVCFIRYLGRNQIRISGTNESWSCKSHRFDHM